MPRRSDSELRLKRSLKIFGLSDAAIDAAWPEWWSREAESSPSAAAELRFSLGRKLGIKPSSLIDSDETPEFVWHEANRFKRYAGKSEHELIAISSFCKAFGNFLAVASRDAAIPLNASASELRSILLQRSQFVGLHQLLAVAWSLSIPVVHLRVFPCDRKRMAAVTTRSADRNVVMLAKDSMYPASIAFYLAHELGHIALGHLDKNPLWIDDDGRRPVEIDPPFAGAYDLPNLAEEEAADEFALELLTGFRMPQVRTIFQRYSARQVAESALKNAAGLKIEPGVLALCLGYTTGNWETANAALKYIYTTRKPVWKEVNDLAMLQLDLEKLPMDVRSYVGVVLGESQHERGA